MANSDSQAIQYKKPSFYNIIFFSNKMPFAISIYDLTEDIKHGFFFKTGM